MKKSIFLFFAAFLCAMSVQGAAIKNISSVYIAGTMNNWSSNNSNWYLGSGNYNKKTFYVAKSNSNYEFKLVINGNWYTKDGYWYTNSNSGPFTGLSLSGNNMQIETKNITTSTKYVSLEFEFYGEYSNENRLTIKQSGVDALSPSLTPSSSNLSDGETSTITTSCSGGSGNYDYTYTVTCGGNDMTATTLSTTSGASVVFTAPTASVEKTYTITVTAKDSHALLSDLQATATTDIVVAASVEKTNIVKISYKCDEDDIETATFQEVGVSTASAITAPVIAGYNFSNWTLGSGVQSADANANPISITTKASGDYTLTANYTAIPKVTVYAVNNAGWDVVSVHHWIPDGAGTTWPGDAMTKIAEKDPSGYDVYTATFVAEHTSCIFNNNNNGKQTGDLTVEDGKYYDIFGNKWYASLEDVPAPDPLATDVYLVGAMNNWNQSSTVFRKAAEGDKTASVAIELAKGTYEFKIVDNGEWYGNDGTMDRTYHENWGFSVKKNNSDEDQVNAKITADYKGNYTFTWNLDKKELTVTYPVWPVFQVTVSVNDETMGSVSGAKEYKDGETAKLVATPKVGYVFVNWTDASSAEVVSSDATYSFTVTKAIALVANFEAEKTHEITISHLCNSNPIAGQEDKTQAVGVATYSKITATEITNYAFKNWTVGSGIKAEDENANPISIITLDEGEYTLVANYTKIENTYTVTVPAGTEKCYIAGDMNSWAFREMTPTGNSNEFTITIDGATKDHKYKYTCGDDWKYVEVKADGSNLDDNRKYAANDVVARWNCAPGIHLVGDMNNWNTAANKFQISGTTATVTIALETGVYKFKVNNDGEWLGNNGTMVRGGDGMDTGWSFESDKDACQLTADIAGDYTFTWNLETKKLTVTYPALPKHQVTATVNPAETGEVTGTGEYEQGSEATLVATPAAGYAFKNWTVGGTEKSTEATYTFTVNEPISLVANFVPEETHEVTVSYLCNATPIPGQTTQTLAVGVTTPSTITAPTIKNYKFDSWTLGTGVQSENATTANPIQITTLATGDYTLTANYIKIELTYNVTVPAGTPACYIAGEMNSWTLTEMTKVDDTHYTITIDGATTEHKYKYACGDSWDYVELKEDGSGVADRTYNSNDVVAKWSTLAKCYLMGNGDWVNGVEMEYDSEHGQYILLCHHISAPFKFKLGNEWSDQVENDNENEVDWVESEPGSGLYNITLPEGDYNFYFKKDSKKAYIEASTPALTRTIPVGYYATVCLRNNIIKVVGATLFEVAGKDGDRVIFDEVITPVAGMPYIFLTEENQISFYCGIETAATPNKHNSLHGTFENMTDAELDGMYMVQNNRIVKCAATGCSIPANRAYFKGTELDALGSAPAQMPGRRRITMGAESENEATGTEDIITPSVHFTKKIVEGQLIIIRDGVKYNAQGQKL